MLKDARSHIVSVFGILGLIGGIWWGINNATLGILPKLFGTNFFNRYSSLINYIKIYLPYIVFSIGALCLLFVIITWIWEKVKRARTLSKENKINEIKDKINEIIEILDSLK